MVTLQNRVLIILFMMYLMVLVNSPFKQKSLTQCKMNIIIDFGWDMTLKTHVRRSSMPKLGFLEKTLDDLKTYDAEEYFKYMHRIIKAKGNTQHPKSFCAVKTQEAQDPFEENIKCVDLLLLKFPDEVDTTEVIKYTFWNRTKNEFAEYEKYDERIAAPAEEKLMTPNEFCSSDNSPILTIPVSRKIINLTFEDPFTALTLRTRTEEDYGAENSQKRRRGIQTITRKL